MEKYFYLDESPLYQNKYVLRIHAEELPFPNGTNGSYNVLAARLLNLSYPDYLRYTRDRLGAELIGRGNKYVIPYFDAKNDVKMLIKVLNKRLEIIMFEREHPYDIIKDEDGTLVKVPFNEDNT